MKNTPPILEVKTQKHHHEDDNCSCNKECKNCKTDQVFDVEKISKEISKLHPAKK